MSEHFLKKLFGAQQTYHHTHNYHRKAHGKEELKQVKFYGDKTKKEGKTYCP